jgi:hypothetical protein
MQKPKYQYESELQIIRDNLYKAGYASEDIEAMLDLMRDKTNDRLSDRNAIIKEVSETMRGNICALRTYYVHDLLAKITGLSPGTIQRIAYTIEFKEELKKLA